MFSFLSRNIGLIVSAMLLVQACSTSGVAAPPLLELADVAPIAQEYAPAPADNPLKGFLPFTDAYSSLEQTIANDFPHSMEWFYVPLKDLMNGPNHFTFDTGLEPTLNDIASRGHQAVFRVYLDYPQRPTGIPRFLLDGGLQVREYSYFSNRPDQSLVPNYDDPQLVTALETFIAALGKRYDGDPRIGFITIGLIGFWGEWHTWPMDGFTESGAEEEDWMPSQANQMRILRAFDQAFNTTRLLLRYPMGQPDTRSAAAQRRISYDSTKLNIGYHDDSFAYETLFGYDWYFMGKMEWRGASNIWQREPIGGELRPELQLGIWLDPPRSDAEDFDLSVDTTHASWLIAHTVFTTSALQGQVYDRALAGARRLGYELYVASVRLPHARSDQPLQVALQMQNTGVAPFYYNWPVQLGVLDAAGQLVTTWNTPWELSTIQPPTDRKTISTALQFTQPHHGLKAGTYRLLMRAANPLPNGKPLRFANQRQDQDLPGWLTLGNFTIES